jgi:hypothetical protein
MGLWSGWWRTFGKGGRPHFMECRSFGPFSLATNAIVKSPDGTEVPKDNRKRGFFRPNMKYTRRISDEIRMPGWPMTVAFYSGIQIRTMYNLSTKGLGTGRYVITLQMPDGRRYDAAFDLR